MKRAVVVAFLVLLVAPAALLSIVPRAHAQMPVAVVSNTSSLDFLDVAKNTITSIASIASSGGIQALVTKGYVLDPIAWALSVTMLKTITGTILKLITGGNGTGQPSFVTNLPGNLQAVGDTQAINFISQYAGQTNSPFAPAIASSLQTNYLQQSSVAGFFATNQCTLSTASPNINSFLAGNWSQGGAAAWLSLTTQSANNPYIQNQIANNQLNTIVTSAQAARVTQLNWGNGYLSWCGSSANGGSSLNGLVSAGVTALLGTSPTSQAASVVQAQASVAAQNQQSAAAALFAVFGNVGEAMSDALNNHAETLFSDTSTSSPSLVFTLSDTALLGRIGQDLGAANAAVADTQNIVNGSESNPDSSATSIENDAQTVATLLNDLATALTEGSQEGNVSASALTAYQSSLATAGTELSSSFSQISSAQGAYDSAAATAANASAASSQANAVASQATTASLVGAGVSAASSLISGLTGNATAASNSATCIAPNGTPGTIKTPGTVIQSQTNTSLASGINKLVNAHSIGEVIGAIAMQLISSVIGGASGGLLGVVQPTSSLTSSLLAQYEAENVSSYTTTGANADGLAEQELGYVSAYDTAWNSIASAAYTASSTLATLSSICSSQASAAQTALASEVEPVILQAEDATSSAAETAGLAAQVEADAVSNAPGAGGALTADTQALTSAPPQASDVATAQSNAAVLGGATASPPGSLTVSGGSIVDQMNLISSDAQALTTTCVGTSTPSF